jgi:beta-galactosidase
MIARRILLVVTLFLSGTFVFGQSAAEHPEWPGKGQLFVGTCYQPVDRSPEQIRQDIALMKQAGFRMARVGDLSWDAFEPAEGRFEFGWSDQILEQMNEAGICDNRAETRNHRSVVLPKESPGWTLLGLSPFGRS